jgi:hypothetical protein
MAVCLPTLKVALALTKVPFFPTRRTLKAHFGARLLLQLAVFEEAINSQEN